MTNVNFFLLVRTAFVGLAVLHLAGSCADAQDRRLADGGISESDATRNLQFSFRSTPWEDVLYWVADKNELIFNLDYNPPGSLNFVDPGRLYTPEEALDEINGQLLGRGFTLVRRNKNLFIVDLESDIDRKYISDLLVLTPVEDLHLRGRFELTKTKFQLTSISTEDAEKQIQEMLGPQGLIITVPLARQLIVSETGENLRRIRDVLKAVENRVSAEGLRAFRLQHAKGEDVLAVARPLLDIEPDASAAEDGSIRISTDAEGRVIYATGAPEKIALTQQIVKQVDSDAMADGMAAELQLRSHRVRREKPEVVLRILETLFAGDRNIRLHPRADSILVYATPDQHKVIEDAINEAEVEPSRIEVIPLRRNDPMLAVALIERMFGADGEEAEENPNAPVVDAMFDPAQLVIRGSAAQIEQIRSLLTDMGERLDADGRALGPTTRILPINPDQMPMAIEQLRQMWPSIGNGNRIRIINRPQAPLIRLEPREEDEPNGRPETQTPPNDNTTDASRYRMLFVSHPGAPAEESDEREAVESPLAATEPNAAAMAPPEIIISSTPDGLVVVSEDAAAVDALEDLLLQVAASGNTSRYSVFHLKHVDAEDTVTLLEELFSAGAPTATEGDSTRSGVMGLFAGGASSVSAPTMIADKRLNRLFVQGTHAQKRDIREYLRVIDVEDGPVDVQTNPKPTYIPVFYTSAESVVTILKELYADRIYDPNAQNRQSPRGFGGFGGFGGRGGGLGGRGGGDNSSSRTTTTGDVPKMTLAAETSSNLVIVSAPGPLVKEVEEVVRQLDVRAQSAPTEGFAVGHLQSGASPAIVKQALVGAYGDFIQTEGEGIQTSSQTSSNRSGTNQGDAAAAQAAQQRRAAFFDAIRRGGGFGGGRGGAGFGGRPGGGGAPPTGGRGSAGPTGGSQRGGGGGGRGR